MGLVAFSVFGQGRVMAEEAPLSSLPFLVSNTPKLLRLLLLYAALAASPAAQAPQQQYVYGSVPLTTTTPQLAAYPKNGQPGALSAVAGPPFADTFHGVPMATYDPARSLLLINT